MEVQPMMMLGKKPATYDERDLQFAHYLDPAFALPPHPLNFGHEQAFPAKGWGMLGNDRAGDCVFAGGAHETMLWNAEAKNIVPFSDACVLSDYSALTGYDPSDPSTDQGTNVRDALKYRQKTGLIDANGVRHKIGAYVALEPGNLQQLLEALYLFGAVGGGFKFPDSAMKQFNKGKFWSVVPGANIEGGHYVPVVARRSLIVGVTWAQTQPMTTTWYKVYNDEAWAILSPEMLSSGKSPEGFDLPTLISDLKEVAV